MAQAFFPKFLCMLMAQAFYLNSLCMLMAQAFFPNSLCMLMAQAFYLSSLCELIAQAFFPNCLCMFMTQALFPSSLCMLMAYTVKKLFYSVHVVYCACPWCMLSTQSLCSVHTLGAGILPDLCAYSWRRLSTRILAQAFFPISPCMLVTQSFFPGSLCSSSREIE